MDNKKNKKDPKIEKLKKELAKIKEKEQENLLGWQRAQADYANLKQETDKRVKELREYTTIDLIDHFLPILDNFNQAYNHIPEEDKNSNWLTGIGYIKKQFEDLIEQLGFTEIQTIGQEFNPEEHEAVEKQKNQEFESGKIIKETQKGYKYKEKVIRPAKVVVAE